MNIKYLTLLGIFDSLTTTDVIILPSVVVSQSSLSEIKHFPCQLTYTTSDRVSERQGGRQILLTKMSVTKV